MCDSGYTLQLTQHILMSTNMCNCGHTLQPRQHNPFLFYMLLLEQNMQSAHTSYYNCTTKVNCLFGCNSYSAQDKP